ncbi:hypothetical protein ACFQS7_30175 [Dankookia sp. GCM10030260]|uniref:hypothetical protein n=1 Tax=Dankookia sp. GCM10030260 TaxID=3273390 RepID=UPI00360B1B80
MTPIADDFAAIQRRLAEIEAAARLLRALPAGITTGPPRQRELTSAELSARYMAGP